MHIHEEVHVYSKLAVAPARSILVVAAVAGMLFGGNAAAAEDHKVTVAIHVSTRGLDLSLPAGAHQFYTRLQIAAGVACTHGNRVDLKPAPDPVGCYEKALGDAIRSANVPLLTQVYLETHTLRQAAARGIDVPAQVAAK
jgi:UrcA family protein